MSRFLWLCGVLAAVLSLNTAARAEDKSAFERWEKSIADIEKRLKDRPPPRDAIFFAGSSSIVNWDLKKSFPDLPVVKVAFGGSQIADTTHFAPRILLEHNPRVIVFYAGDNDLASGKSPEKVYADFQDFLKVVHTRLPRAKILYLSIKPSISRWKLVDKVRKANSLIEAECKKTPGVMFVDVGSVLLGEDGMPRKELFVKD